MSDKISIIMPAKNAGEFLEETLNSIQNQSFKDWECICVNDNSTDATLEILKSYSNLDKRFLVVNNEKSGVISALQCGYESSTGNYITRMDADDVMPKDKLKSFYREVQKHPRDVVITGKVEYFNTLGEGFIRYQNWLNKLVDQKSHWQNLYKECVIASPNWLVSRQDFELAEGFGSELYPEDYDLVFRFYKAGLKVKALTGVTHLWRDHESRASRVSDVYANNNFVPLKLKYFKELHWDQEKILVLWGAGKKGKEIAKELIVLEVPFTWITDNPKKIGVDIYGVILKGSDLLESEEHQVILAVSSPLELESIEEGLTEEGFELGSGYFVFS